MSIQLHLEISSVCQAKCGFCVYKSKENQSRERGMMKWPLFTKIIDEAKTIPEINNVAFSGLGEMLLNKDFEKMVAYTRAASDQWFIENYTNGEYLTPERFEAIKAAGIHYLSVSLNAVRPEQHEKIMGLRDKFELVCSNIEYARAHPGDVNILVKAVVDGKNFTEADANELISRWGRWQFPADWRDYKGQTGAVAIHQGNWAGGVETTHPFDVKEGCSRAFGQIAIDRNGTVLLCCFDPLAKNPFGEVRTHTIREVYNTEKYYEFRKAHWENRADEYEVCRNCTRI
jgi:radical SAM protein with 4Fe4S-binding SPASM domain